MSTRTGARIYRGPSRTPLQPGACPSCFRVVTVNANGKRRAHRDADGRHCTGSGVPVGDPPTVLLDDLPDIRVGPERIDDALRRERSYIDGRRIAVNGRAVCDGCGRELPLNGDGTIRRHRVRHQDPLAPYCEGAA